MPQISGISRSAFGDGASVTITGSDFGTTQGTVTIGGQPQTVTEWFDNSVTFTAVRGSQNLGTARLAVVKGAGGTLIASANFDSGAVDSGWYSGAQSGGSLVISSDTAENYGSSVGSAHGTIPSGAGVFTYLGRSVSALNLSDIYIQFKAKFPSTTKGGIKFCKIHGKETTSGNYANVTLGLESSPAGAMTRISFGDGSTVANDTAQVLFLSGYEPSWIGRSYGSAVVSTPQGAAFAAASWGTTWHQFRIHVKFNSGTTALNEVNDGQFYLEIDGIVYVDATGLFNRHYSNPPIDYIELFGYSDAAGTMELWFDEIVLSTGGFV